MARRPATSSESNSSQAIDERPIGVKKEKMRRVRVEEEVEEDGEGITLADGQGDEENEENINGATRDTNESSGEEEDGREEASGSMRSAKRQRTSAEGDYNGVPRKPRTNEALVRDTDGYVTGSVVRFKFQNFLTYDNIEFRPGPFLNLVLGPNGTGKSSIACALCIGLNFDPKLLGRATRLNQFLRMKAKQGFIEIELKGPPGGQNLIIRRELDQEMVRQASFTINGEKASGAVVSEKVRELGIQMDNLCSFLPQDKVAEFAKMTPQQLLRATEEAAGDKRLKKWHDKLIELGRDVSKMGSECVAEIAEINTLEERNRREEGAVNAYRKRKTIEDEIRFLELLLPFKEYTEAVVEYKALKERRNALYDKVKEHQERNKPAQILQKNLEAEVQRLTEERVEIKKRAKSKMDSMKLIWDKAEKVRTESEKIDSQLESIKAETKNRQKRMSDLRKNIHSLEDIIANPPELEDLNAIRKDEDRCRNEQNRIQRAKHDLGQSMGDKERRINITKQEQEQAEKRLKSLDDINARKLEELRRWDSDTASAVEWLRKNQQRFQKPVIEPAALSVIVEKPRFAKAVEGGFNASQLKTFVFQSDEDYKLFNRLVCDTTEAVGKRCRVSTWFRAFNPNAILPAPMSDEEIKQLGFQAYAIDCIKYPEGMEFYLKTEVKIHRLAIDVDGRVDMQRAMDMVTRPSPNGRAGQGSFIIRDILSNVGRSQYGRKESYNNTRTIANPKSFSEQPPDEAKKREQQDIIMQKTQYIEDIEKEVEVIRTDMQKVDDKLTEINNSLKRAQDRLRARRLADQKIQSDRLKLADQTKKLQELENAPSAEAQKAQLREQSFNLAKKRSDFARELKVTVHEAMTETRRGTEAFLTVLQKTANLAALKSLLEAADLRWAELSQEFNSVDEEFKRMKGSTKQKLNISKAKLEAADPETRSRFEAAERDRELDNTTAETVREDLAERRASLEVNIGANPVAVQQYEDRERQIKSRKAALEEKEDKKKIKEDRVKSLVAKWHPALQELIDQISEKFSAGFDRVGCLGEVRLGTHPEDFTDWRIEILVSFRATEQLRLLTGTRQSGGERSLSTVTYIMSLVEHACPPFSLVDEINQGMDQNYERAVHNSLVDVTCGSKKTSIADISSGQYFLVTPKLLTDLKYHERMKVLCIFNGVHVPENNDGNLKGMIDRVVKRRTLRGQMVAAAA